MTWTTFVVGWMRRLFVAAAVLAAVCVLIFRFCLLNRFEVRNHSGVEVRDLQFVLSNMQGAEVARMASGSLAPGALLSTFSVLADSRAEWSFTLRGTRVSGSENYIDLWAGENWVFEIEDDGSVRSSDGRHH